MGTDQGEELEGLIAQGRALLERLDTDVRGSSFDNAAGAARVLDFLASHAGTSSSYYQQLAASLGSDRGRAMGAKAARPILLAFLQEAESGRWSKIPLRRQAQLDVVADYMGMADELLKQYHHGAAAVVVGATLEEFLRTWAERAGVSDVGRPGIAAYANALRAAEELTKQDVKELTAWAGLRNSAAHGHWDDISAEQAQLMLAGANAFLSRYQR